MRIALDCKQLLGFDDNQGGLDVPALGAKVGTKTDTVGVRTAGHDELLKTVPAKAVLTFPAKS